MAEGKALNDLSVRIDIDDSQFNKSLDNLASGIGKFKSEFKKIEDGVDTYTDSLDALRSSNDKLNIQLDSQRKKVDELKRKYEESVKAKGDDDKATKDLKKSYDKAKKSMGETESKVNDLNKAFKNQKDIFGDVGQGFEKLGGKLKDFGGNLSTTLTPAIAGIGTAFIASASQAENSTARIQRSLGLSREEAEKLNGVTRELWKDGFGDSMTDVEDGLLSVKQNIKNLNGKDLKQVAKDSMYLADTFNSDVNEVTRAGNNLMKNFGITSSEAFDLMAWGGQKGLNFSQEMFDNLSEYSPLFADMGFSAEEYFSLLQKGTDAGVYNLDYVNDAMKEFQIRAKDGSKATSDAMSQLSDSTQDVFKDFKNGKATVKDLHNAVIKDLEGMDNQVIANQIGVGLYGTKWEDLEADAMYAMGGIDGGLKDLDGAMGRSGDAVEKTFGEKAKIAWREFQDAMLPIGEDLLEIAEDILPKVSDAIDDMSDWWNGLSDGAKDFALALGGIALVAPPLIATVGTIGGAFGALLPMVAGTTGTLVGTGGFTAALGLLTNPVGLTIGTLALLGLGFVALDKEMDKPIIKSDIFAGKVSESTEKIIGDYTKLKDESEIQLNEMAWGNEEITQKHVDNMVAKYKEMSDQILAQMDIQHTEEKAKMMKFFAESDALSKEEEAKILADLDKQHIAEREKVIANNEKKSQITQESFDKHGKLTEEANLKIQALENENYAIMIDNSVKNAEEQQTILRNLKNQAGILSAEKAGEVVKNSVKERDETVKEAEKKYNENVAWIEYERDVTKNISADKADKLIKDAEHSKNKVVADAEDTHYEVVKNAQDQAGKHVDEVDWETGSVMNRWDKMWNGIADVWNPIAELFGADKMEERGVFEPNGRQKKKNNKASIVARAKGTPDGTHEGGMALVGEEGYELAHIPNQGYTMLGVGGQEIIDLPKGSSVLPHGHTKDLLKKYHFPAYKDGVGDFNIFEKGAKSIWDHFMNETDFFDKYSMPDWFISIEDIMSKIGSKAVSKIGDLKDNFFSFDAGGSFSGGGATMARNAISKALSMLGKSQSFLPGLMQIAFHESGYNPRAINNWDINAQRGDPSVGLFQIINSTFQRWKYPGANDRTNPLHSALAAIKYLDGRYGGIQNHPGLRSMARGGGYKPYAKGGVIDEETYAVMGEDGKREYVIPVERYSNRAKDLWTQAGIELGMLSVPQPQSYQSIGGQGMTTTNSSKVMNNHYYVNVAYTGSTNDQDVATLAKQIREHFERQDMRNSRALGGI